MSCSKKESNVNVPTPVLADFEMTATGASPNATVKFVNKTTGATSYKWSFWQGSSVTTAADMNPADINVDKASFLPYRFKPVTKMGAKR
jgi:PKD repeat protein